MFNSLIGTRFRTTCKIVAVALVRSISMLMLSTSLVISVAAWRVETEAATARTPDSRPVFAAGKAAIPATADAPTIR